MTWTWEKYLTSLSSLILHQISPQCIYGSSKHQLFLAPEPWHLMLPRYLNSCVLLQILAEIFLTQRDWGIPTHVVQPALSNSSFCYFHPKLAIYDHLYRWFIYTFLPLTSYTLRINFQESKDFIALVAMVSCM